MGEGFKRRLDCRRLLIPMRFQENAKHSSVRAFCQSAGVDKWKGGRLYLGRSRRLSAGSNFRLFGVKRKEQTQNENANQSCADSRIRLDRPHGPAPGLPPASRKDATLLKRRPPHPVQASGFPCASPKRKASRKPFLCLIYVREI